MNRTITLLVCVLLAVTLVPAATAARASTNLQPTLVSTDPFPVTSGDDAELYFKLRNTGNSPAENVTVALLDRYPFTVKPDRSASRSLGTVSPGEEYYISTEVLIADDAPDGANDFAVRIESGGVDRVVYIPVTIQSTDADLSLANLETEPARLLPDTDGNVLSVDVLNMGDGVAENVRLELGLPHGFEPVSSFSHRQSLGDIAGGTTASADFTVDLNASVGSGMTTIPATLIYGLNDSSSTVHQDVSFALNINGAPRFDLVSLESDLTAGEKGTITATVRNIGEKDATSSRVRILDNADQPFSYASASQFVGTLEPGESGTVVFEVTPEQDASAKEYLLDIEVRGVQRTEVFVDDFTERVTVRSTGNTGIGAPSGILPAVLVLLVLAGGVAVWYRRRG